MDFTTKHLKLSERVELNNLMDVENIYDSSGKVVKTIVRKFFGYQVKAVLFGLETLNGKEIEPKNLEETINDLTNSEITEIAQQVFDETNISKKKKS